MKENQKKRKSEEGETQIAVRLSSDIIDKIDAEMERLSDELGMKITRANVIRGILKKHFEVKSDQ